MALWNISENKLFLGSRPTPVDLDAIIDVEPYEDRLPMPNRMTIAISILVSSFLSLGIASGINGNHWPLIQGFFMSIGMLCLFVGPFFFFMRQKKRVYGLLINCMYEKVDAAFDAPNDVMDFVRALKEARSGDLQVTKREAQVFWFVSFG